MAIQNSPSYIQQRHVCLFFFLPILDPGATGAGTATSYQTGKCAFWKWEAVHLEVLRAKRPRLSILPGIETNRSQATLKWILVVGILNLAAVLHLCLKNY
ncbi:hypothetical protein VPH35_015979 [Triticum aestivum]|uniref:Uncharacterized protein n=1 Tax=Aegilops tauschii TaxID=37682 RepID=N1R151_AEGTA